MSESIDPTFYGSNAPPEDDIVSKKRKLEKKAHIKEVITGDERFIKLRADVERNYATCLEALLSPSIPLENIPLIRAQAQVHKGYKDYLDRMEKDGVNAVEELKTFI